METTKRKTIQRGVLIAIILVFALAGTILIFARGLDADKRYATYPDWLALLSFAIPFPVFLGMEKFFNKDGDYDFPYIRGDYQKALNVSLFIEGVALIAGITLLFAFQEGALMVLACAIASHGGFIFFLIFMLIQALLHKNDLDKQGLATLILALVLLLASLIVCTVATAVTANVGYSLLLLGSPLAILILVLKKIS